MRPPSLAIVLGCAAAACTAPPRRTPPLTMPALAAVAAQGETVVVAPAPPADDPAPAAAAPPPAVPDAPAQATAPAAAAPAPSTPAPVPPARTGAPDALALGLAEVEARLFRGDLDRAVTGLLDLARQFPADTRARARLARVLHQRALLRFGHGEIAGAIHDWERVIELDPGQEVAKQLLLEARSAPPLPPRPAR